MRSYYENCPSGLEFFSQVSLTTNKVLITVLIHEVRTPTLPNRAPPTFFLIFPVKLEIANFDIYSIFGGKLHNFNRFLFLNGLKNFWGARAFSKSDPVLGSKWDPRP